MAPYQYETLGSPTTQIRLLELLPGRRGTIQCRLKVVNLQEAKGTYEPISYCWKTYKREHWWGGSYKEKKKQKNIRVLVDGLDLFITESLQAALRHMRLENETRVLWADAICINQTDDEEKSAQVAIMGKIYQNGYQTLVWLGAADCWTRWAFRYMRRTDGHESEDSSSTRYSTDEYESEDYTSTGYSEDEHEPRSANEGRMICPRNLRLVWELCGRILAFLASRSILNRPYFERAWIVQEIVLSGTVVLLCGKHEATGSELFNWLSGDRAEFRFTALRLIEHGIVDLWHNAGLYCLDSIISKLAHMKTSDPRDKFYSAVSLLHQECMNCGSITVDYRKNADEVFLDATKIILSGSVSIPYTAVAIRSAFIQS